MTRHRTLNGDRGTRNREQGTGFTLLELVVVIAVIGILAAAVAPSVIQQVMDSRVEGTRAEAQAIAAAMTDRFAPDIGRLPSSLAELSTRGSLPAYSTGNVRNVGMGWRGPYVNAGTSTDDFLTDAFGRAYTLAAGQIRSAGVDGIVNTADDIVNPPSPPVVTGDVTVTLRQQILGVTIVDPSGYRVDLYYPNNGSQATLTDTTAPFSFSNVPIGARAVQVVKTSSPGFGSVVAQDTVVIRSGQSTAAELWF